MADCERKIFDPGKRCEEVSANDELSDGDDGAYDALMDWRANDAVSEKIDSIAKDDVSEKIELRAYEAVWSCVRTLSPYEDEGI